MMSMRFAHGSKAENSLRRNPFYVLGATTRDNRGRIGELAEQRALTRDPVLCQTARSVLEDPRPRLSAELSWLPGVAPERATEVAEFLDPALSKKGSKLPPLARANALAARIESGSIEQGEIVRALLELSTSFDEIDLETLMREINRDRSIASFPILEDVGLLDAELAERRRYYGDVSLRLLDGLPTKELVRLVTELAAKSTENGRKRASSLIEDIVERYENAAQAFIEGETFSVRKLLSLISMRAASGEREISRLVESLCATLGNWNSVTKPIQIVSRAKGDDHPASRRLALQTKSLSAELRSERDLAPAADKIMGRLRQEFAFVSEFASRAPEEFSDIAEDFSEQDLGEQDLSENDQSPAGDEGENENENEDEDDDDEFDESLSFSVDVGAVFKN